MEVPKPATDPPRTQWPPPARRRTATLARTAHPDPVSYLASCAPYLGPGGCLAVVVHNPQDHDTLGVLVGTGRDAGLTYLQHIVVVHYLHAPADDAVPATDAERLRPGQTHLRVHTDVLVFRHPESSRGSRTGSRP